MFKSLFTKLIVIAIILLKLQTASAQSFETVMRKSYVLLTIAQERDRQAAENLDDIKTRRIRAEEDYVDLQEHNKIPKKEREKAENQIKLLRKQEDDTGARQGQSGQIKIIQGLTLLFSLRAAGEICPE